MSRLTDLRYNMFATNILSEIISVKRCGDCAVCSVSVTHHSFRRCAGKKGPWRGAVLQEKVLNLSGAQCHEATCSLYMVTLQTLENATQPLHTDTHIRQKPMWDFPWDSPYVSLTLSPTHLARRASSRPFQPAEFSVLCRDNIVNVDQHTVTPD